MATVNVYPDGPGVYGNYTRIRPQSIAAHEAIDEPILDGQTVAQSHDGETTWIAFDNTISPAIRHASFSFGGNTNVIPTQVVINFVHKWYVANATISVGFVLRKTGEIAIDGVPNNVLQNGWEAGSRTFATNPITGADWTLGQLRQLELYVRADGFGWPLLTMLNATITYERDKHIEYSPNPRVTPTG